MRKVSCIVHNVRSCHNVGSILRTAECLGIAHIYLTGHTPYPISDKDVRLPHIAQKAHKTIAKTALGAEALMSWSHHDSVIELLEDLRQKHTYIAALELTKDATPLHEFTYQNNIAFIVGREVEGIEQEVVNICDQSICIPMKGKKESLNVAQAAAIAMYALTTS